jgi:hypothetical protein
MKVGSTGGAAAALFSAKSASHFSKCARNDTINTGLQQCLHTTNTCESVAGSSPKTFI